VKEVAQKLQKKSSETREQLKYLRNAFAKSCDFIEAFLDTDNSLYSLVGYLTGNDTNLQLEAVWCITNITANDYKNISDVVKASSAYLVTFLRSGSVLLQDQSAWALGNMAAEDTQIREILKAQGIITPLVNLVEVCIIIGFIFLKKYLQRSIGLTSQRFLAFIVKMNINSLTSLDEYIRPKTIAACIG